MSITGTDGIQDRIKDGKMIVQKPCLWISYTCHFDNGMAVNNDGFYEGSVPLTRPMLTQLKIEIGDAMQAQFDAMPRKDQQGKLIMGAPKPKVMGVELRCIVPAEIPEEVAVN